MEDLINKISEALAQHFDSCVSQELDKLMPIPKDIASLDELHEFTLSRNAKYLSDDEFSIDHCDCEIENEYDSLLYRIAQKAFDIERARGTTFRKFRPLVSIVDNKHKYGRQYKLYIQES